MMLTSRTQPNTSPLHSLPTLSPLGISTSLASILKDQKSFGKNDTCSVTGTYSPYSLKDTAIKKEAREIE